MRNVLGVLWMLLCAIAPATAQVSVGFEIPGASIGINVPVYPQLAAVPGYPVYYAPQMNSNYFFYDGMYWVYQRDNWYASSWYNGPWGIVAPEAVPLFVLRVPVRYYRSPPVYFRGWSGNAPPHWGDHWGNSWQQSRVGWDNWNRSAVPQPAPLPVYQRQYAGTRYPRVDQQPVIQSQSYRYQPQDTAVQRQYQAQRVYSAPPPSQQRPQVAPPPSQQRAQGAPTYSPPVTQAAPQQAPRGPVQPISVQQPAPQAPRGQPPQKGGADVQRPAAAQAAPQQSAPPAKHQAQHPQQGPAPQQQQAPKGQGQDKRPQGPAQEPKQSQEKGHEKSEQQGGEHNK